MLGNKLGPHAGTAVNLAKTHGGKALNMAKQNPGMISSAVTMAASMIPMVQSNNGQQQQQQQGNQQFQGLYQGYSG